jgi:hypothetical protein
MFNESFDFYRKTIMMVGAMKTGTATVIQFALPFGGAQDRVRAAAEAGRVVMMREARLAMRRDDISDILIIRSLKRAQLAGSIRCGENGGEWRCGIVFVAKGFRSGGILIVVISNGRAFVEDIIWDRQP